MLLNEMFSPIGAPKESELDIDWVGDLKFYIDNNNDMLSRYMFPAVKKHKKYLDHPRAYKIYIKPITQCLSHYCEKYKVDNKEEKFPEEVLLDLAKAIADEQKRHLENGDYENK